MISQLPQFNLIHLFFFLRCLFGCSGSQLWDKGPSIFIAAWRIFSCGTRTLSCSMWDLVPFSSVQFSSVAQSCPTLCDPMNCSTPGLAVPHYLPEFAQVHVHLIGDAIQPSQPLLPSSPSAFNLSQHGCLFHWVGCLHQVAKILELQLQHQPFQWIFRVDFL